MKRPTYIFGHLNPDTDSICSAIAYGELKRELDEDNTDEWEVCRLGSISKETDFALKHFGIEVPRLLENVKPQLSDLPYYKPVTVSKECSLSATWSIMKSSENSRIVGITNEDGTLDGIASLGDLARIFMDRREDVLIKKEVLFSNMLEIIEGTVIKGKLPFRALEGRILPDHNIDNIDDIDEKDVIVITNLKNMVSFSQKCKCIIIPRYDKFQHISFDGVDCCIITSNASAFHILTVVVQAISIGSIMANKNIEYFTLDDNIEDVIEATGSSTHRNFPVLDKEGRLVGIISRRHLINYKRKKVILIDHNESHQTAEGIEHADIIEIIDHHRVANVQTQTPLFIRSEPVGATATIIFKMYMENFLRPSKNVAGIMLSAILSDTLMFTSPTCTKEDKEAAHKLAKIAGLDLDEYGELMFKESSNFDDYTEEQILEIDMKEFSLGKYRIVISQVNTIEFKKVLERRDRLLKQMEIYKEKSGCDLVVLVITDIINTGSEILGTNAPMDILFKAFGIRRGENSIYLKGVVSRKKQIVPLLMKAAHY